jgi:hypothetical protein
MMARVTYYNVALTLMTYLPVMAFAQTKGIAPIIDSVQSSLVQTQITENWYVSGNTLQLPPDRTDTLESPNYQVNGGYQHPLLEELNLFVEAGMNSDLVNHEFEDIATQRGFSMATGVSYTPIKGLTLQSRLSQQLTSNDGSGDQLDFKLSSAYQIQQKVAITASFTLSDNELQPQTQQQLEIGVGYRF